MQADLLHVSIYVYDTKAAVRFYQELFDARLLFSQELPSGERLTMIKIGNFELELMEAADESEKVSLMRLNNMTPNHFALEVEDVELALENLESVGAMAEDGIKQIELPPGVPAKIAFIHGPGGERIELYQKL